MNAPLGINSTTPAVPRFAPQSIDRMMAMADLRELWLMVCRRRKLIMGCMGAFAVVALLLALVLPNQYRAETMLMLDSRKTNVTDVEAVISGLAPDVTAINSEITIILSRAVLDRVITKLDLLKNPEFNKRLGVMSWLRGVFGDTEAAPEEEVADRTRISKLLRDNLTVSNANRSYSIAIAYSAGDPQIAALVANAFADEYLVDQLEAKYDMTQRANTWLAGRLDNMRDEVQKAERAVEVFKQANNLTGVGEETITQQQLVAINTQLVEAKAEQTQATAKLESVEQIIKSKGNLSAASSVLSSPLIQGLQQQEAEVGRREAEMSMRYGARHPTIINARSELREIRAKIGSEVDKIVQGMRNDADIANAKVENLQKQLAKLEDTTGTGNQAMVQLRQLQREAESSRSLYEGFLNRYKQVAEQQDLQMPDARVIAKAVPPLKPHFPNKTVFLIIGLVAGALVGLLASLIIEYFDQGFRGINEIERLTGVSGIGMVPALTDLGDKGAEDYVLEKPLSAYAEALRTVRTAIHFSNVDTPPKVVMVTSSVPGEGKTTFCVSLARVLSKAGSKVLLIDADLRRPRVHSMLRINKEAPDLTKVLTGEATASSAIQRDSSGADVIMARGKAPNPQDLLGSKQMQRLLDTLRPQYDVIIIDTPPVMAVADAAMVAAMADTSLYLVRWASTPREVVLQGVKHLAGFHVKLAGIVLTQVDLEQQQGYGYGDYGYYYGRYKDYYTN
jgi:succinoglycan biosynthesis transport protein ExoP